MSSHERGFHDLDEKQIDSLDLKRGASIPPSYDPQSIEDWGPQGGLPPFEDLRLRPRRSGFWRRLVFCSRGNHHYRLESVTGYLYCADCLEWFW